MVFAQTDEIQVYDGSLAKPGAFNLTLHTNFIPSGLRTPAFPGAVVADKSLNGVPEWAYGVNRWLEVGLYLTLPPRGWTHHFVPSVSMFTGAWNDRFDLTCENPTFIANMIGHTGRAFYPRCFRVCQTAEILLIWWSTKS